jgi:hypothetical protein
MEPWRTVVVHNGGVKRLNMEPWRVGRSVVADSHHFGEDPDPD